MDSMTFLFEKEIESVMVSSGILLFVSMPRL